MTHKVLITTSGIGQRLGELTRYTNKALVRVGSKPVISRIIESYPKDTRFVVTLGYKGEQVRDFLALAYPDLAVEFVEIDRFEGPGTSLGYSLLKAKDALQCPFIYHACDTIVSNPIPAPERNWIGVYIGDDTSQYASWTVQEGKLQFHDKGATDTDFIHIGLVGIKDYAAFWRVLDARYRANPESSSLNDCEAIVGMIGEGIRFDTIEYPVWHDIGNVAALNRARRAFGSSPDDLDKSGEAVFIFDDFVIKFFADERLVAQRAQRGELLKGFVPAMQGQRGNFYRYAFVPGELYSHVVHPDDFKRFLAWAQTSFWKPEAEVDGEKFKSVCDDFYRGKTLARLNAFLTEQGLADTEHVINGERVPTIQAMLDTIDLAWLTDGLQSRFHGDFILDNIVKTNGSYCLIDWRQNFGGLLAAGDRYYDLAKLNHNLTVNHRIVNQNLFTVETSGTEVTVDILRPSALVECQQTFFDFLRERGYDAHKVRVLTAIIWLNMAPLHHHPFNLFLYYYGKLNLWRALQRTSSTSSST